MDNLSKKENIRIPEKSRGIAKDSLPDFLRANTPDVLAEARTRSRNMGIEDLSRELDRSGFAEKYKAIAQKFEQAVKKFKVSIALSIFSISMAAPELSAQISAKEQIPPEVPGERVVLSAQEIQQGLISDKVERSFISFSDRPGVEIQIAIGQQGSVSYSPEDVASILEDNKESREIIFSHTHPLKAHEAFGIDTRYGIDVEHLSEFLGAPPSLPDILSALEDKKSFETADRCVKERVYGVDGVWDFELSGVSFLEEYKKFQNEVAEILKNFSDKLTPAAKIRFEEILAEDPDNMMDYIEKDEIFDSTYEELEAQLQHSYDKHQDLLQILEDINVLQAEAGISGAARDAVAPKLRQRYIEMLKKYGIHLRFTPNPKQL